MSQDEKIRLIARVLYYLSASTANVLQIEGVSSDDLRELQAIGRGEA